MASSFTHFLVELELEDVRNEVSDVWCIVGNVELGSGVEVDCIVPNDRRNNALD